MNTAGLTILMIGEHNRLQDGLYALLSSLPYRPVIEQALPGVAALTLLSERCPQLVLLDADLSDVNALAILRIIKNERDGPRCIVLADTMEQQAAAQAAGADAALLKGFPAAELFATLRRLLPEGSALQE